MKQHFAKRERVEDSWFVLSLEKGDQAEAEIALFLSGEVAEFIQEPEKPLVTIVDMGESYDAKILDAVDLIENYQENAPENVAPENVAPESAGPDSVAPAQASQIENISVRVRKENNVMFFENGSSNVDTSADAEIIKLRSEVSRLSGMERGLCFILFEKLEQSN